MSNAYAKNRYSENHSLSERFFLGVVNEPYSLEEGRNGIGYNLIGLDPSATVKKPDMLACDASPPLRRRQRIICFVEQTSGIVRERHAL